MDPTSHAGRRRVDPKRIRILFALLEAGELCVCDLAAATNVTDTPVSQNMRLLRTAESSVNAETAAPSTTASTTPTSGSFSICPTNTSPTMTAEAASKPSNDPMSTRPTHKDG